MGYRPERPNRCNAVPPGSVLYVEVRLEVPEIW